MLARSARALVAAQARASNAGAAYYATGNDPSITDKMRETVSEYHCGLASVATSAVSAVAVD